MGRKGRRRLRTFSELVAQTHLELDKPLRGEAKLEGAFAMFDVAVAHRVALDAGAAAGGFTRVLLRHGARRVYAVDAGHGQLVGSLRQDPRVVNLEATNLGELGPRLVPERIELVTLDLSYLALSDAVPQLDALDLADAADLVGLVKPQFELHLPTPPVGRRALRLAVETATHGVSAAGWDVRQVGESPVRGARGSVEFLLWARRRAAAASARATAGCPASRPRGST